jgi:hypothetical protein
MSDWFIAAAVISPLVLGAIWLLLRDVARADRHAAQALVARLDCPRCRTRSLEWRGVVWGEDVLHDDREESFQGYNLCCPRCGGVFQYTHAGELHMPEDSPP